MLKNYFKIAIRNLLRNKIFSLVNILGLAIGMAACLLIVLFIIDELSFDQHNVKKDRMYRVEGFYAKGGQTMEQDVSTSFALAPLLKSAFPEIETFVRLNVGGNSIKYNNKIYREDKVCYADSSFFELFTCRFITGNPLTALNEPNTVVIDEPTSQKYFGKTDPIGQMLGLDEQLVKVTAVISEMPRTSHFRASMIVSVKTVLASYPPWVNNIHSGGTSHYTYIALPHNYDHHLIEAQLNAFTEKYMGVNYSKHIQLYFQPFNKIHLYSHTGSEIEPNGDIMYVYIFAIVAVVVLLIACINYVNLTTARAIDRAKEIGLRKVTGASRLQLISQFLGESVLISIFAMIFAYVIALLSLSKFNELSNKDLSLNVNNSYPIFFSFIGFALLVGVLAGLYPAFFITSIKITRVLKGNVSKTNNSSLLLRKGLVVFQFSISIVLIISMLLIYSQLQFIRNKKLGIDPEQLLSIQLSAKTSEQYRAFKTELLKNSKVLGISSANNDLTSGGTNWRQYTCKNDEIKNVNVATMDVDADFFTALNAKIIAGRGFSNARPGDITDAYIVNETAAKFLNLKNPVNEPLTGTLFNGKDWATKKGKIIGVVKDFHFASMHQEIKPVVFNLQSESTDRPGLMFLRISGSDIPASINFLQTTWKNFEPEFPFLHSFLDEDIKSLYKAEESFLQVFIAFGCLAVFIACLGIFGLSSYTAQQRTKEIGIRKVLGASVSGIFLLLSSDYVKLILLAVLIASPIGWYMMDKWLQDYAYRMNIPYWIFIVAGATALMIALITISQQAIKAAIANPVKSLRTE